MVCVLINEARVDLTGQCYALNCTKKTYLVLTLVRFKPAPNLLCLCVLKPAFTGNLSISQRLNIALFCITLILSLAIPFSKDDWKNLTDPYDYLHQSKISLCDKEFYFPHVTREFDPRPFTVPLFYKLCGSNTDVIVQMQKFMLLLSAFFMAAAFMLFMEKSSAKYITIVTIYFLVSWWNVMGWATLVLSEALSTALLFCWLASFLFFYKKGTWPWWLLHVIITILFSFTRDSWPYVLISFYGGICTLWFFFKQRNLKQYGALLILSIGLFFIQQAGAKTGLRSKLPVINSIVVRVLPNPDYTAWFTQQGMPDAEKLTQNFGKIDVVPIEGQHKLWSLYDDSAYQSFLNWVVEKGQPTYTRFLLTHPSYLFLTQEPPEKLARIMSYNLFYIDEPRGYTRYVESAFPLFNVGVVIALCIMLLLIYTQRKTPILFGPVLLALFTLLNVILSYNADALEVERHLFITNVLVQLAGFWAAALIWDSLVWRKDLKN